MEFGWAVVGVERSSRTRWGLAATELFLFPGLLRFVPVMKLRLHGLEIVEATPPGHEAQRQQMQNHQHRQDISQGLVDLLHRPAVAQTAMVDGPAGERHAEHPQPKTPDDGPGQRIMSQLGIWLARPQIL